MIKLIGKNQINQKKKQINKKKQRFSGWFKPWFKPIGLNQTTLHYMLHLLLLILYHTYVLRFYYCNITSGYCVSVCSNACDFY